MYERTSYLTELHHNQEATIMIVQEALIVLYNVWVTQRGKHVDLISSLYSMLKMRVEECHA